MGASVKHSLQITRKGAGRAAARRALGAGYNDLRNFGGSEQAGSCVLGDNTGRRLMQSKGMLAHRQGYRTSPAALLAREVMTHVP